MLGLSGTPWRDDGADLLMEAVVGPVIHRATRGELIEVGLLVPCDILLVELPQKKYAAGLGYAARKKDYILQNPVINVATAEFCEHMVQQGKSVMVLADLLEHIALLDNLLTSRGISHTCMAGSGKFGTDPERRGKVWIDFQEKRNLVLVTNLANEGLDIPSLDSVVIAGGGESTVRTLQRIRCMTAYPGKEYCTILDFAHKARFFSRHFQERLRMYTSEPGNVFRIKRVTRFSTMDTQDAHTLLGGAFDASASTGDPDPKAPGGFYPVGSSGLDEDY